MNLLEIYNKGLSKRFLFALLCLIASGCSPDALHPVTNDDGRLEMVLPRETFSKAHFEDDGTTASFIWDAGNSMIATVSKSGSLAQWKDGGYHSPMNITLIDPSDHSKVLKASSSLTLAADAAQADDKLFFLSPVGSPYSQMTESSENVAVTFSVPATFEQSTSGRLEEFEDRCYIHGESTIMSIPDASDKNFTANATTFTAIPATFRYNITNDTEADILIESVKITCDKLFPDKLCWSTDGSSMSISEPADKSGYFNTIKTTIASGKGEKIAAKTDETTSKGTYYAMCLPFDSDDSMSGATLAFILETDDKVHTFNVSAEEFFRDAETGHKKFEGNKIYTFNFKWTENSVELEGITVADWVSEPFYLPTEEVSAFVVVRPSYWNQDRENLNTYAFVKMNQTESSYTMWGECNIGEYLVYSVENLFSWKAVTPADVSDTDYLSIYFNNITDFKWETPSREDFTALFNVAADKIQMCTYQESGVFGLKINSEINPGAYIFLPVSALEEHTEYPETGGTVITRYYHGRYWTKDEDETDDTNAYLLHFEFKRVETVDEDDVSTFSEFTRVLNDGNDIYEFQTASKQVNHTVRAIIHHDF
ncbi:MAG: hypothetical protein ACI3ZL_00890 [Candidatus Cryptobacteroides sp.]